MKISDFLSKDLFIAELKSSDKNEAINELIDLFSSDPRVEDIEDVRKNVFEREKIMSTGIGKGFAVPHGKSDSIKEIIAAFGRSIKGIDFDAIDGQPVNLIFLIVGRNDSISTHIKLLSRISRMMNKDDFRNRLLNAANAEELYKVFIEEESNYFDL
jgi:fructose-specific phosphotransferase system IIA component